MIKSVFTTFKVVLLRPCPFLLVSAWFHLSDVCYAVHMLTSRPTIRDMAGWTGSDYTGFTTDFHVGYEGKLFYNIPWEKTVPTTSKVAHSLVTPDGGSDETVPSGKAGLGFASSVRLEG